MATKLTGSPDRASILAARISTANKAYEDWESKYGVKQLERFYEGFQADDQTKDPEESYTLNLFWSTIETKLPSYSFLLPVFHVRPKPRDVANEPELAFEYAGNLADAGNAWVEESNNRFAEEIEAATLASFFRFGIIEVNYSASYVENPKAGKPVFKSSVRNDATQGSVLREPKQLPEEEQVYIRAIPPDNFRMSSFSSRYLERCDWCGYFEMILIEDLIADKTINFSKHDIDASTNCPEFDWMEAQGSKINTFDTELLKSGKYAKIWKLWDTRAKEMILFSETHNKVLKISPYTIFPFEDLRYRKPLRGFLPIPYTFNWTSPQKEINEVRNSNRAHRRKMRRMYTYIKGRIHPEEVQKLMVGDDGTYAEATADNPVQPIPNADLGASHNISMQVTQSDFNIISGTTAEQRQQVEAGVTATQADIANNRAIVRETHERNVVAKWLCRVFRKVLMIMKHKFVNQIDVSVTPQSIENQNFLGDVQTQVSARRIDPITDFGQEDFDFSVDVEVATTSPVANEQELQKMLQFLALLTQYPQFSISPLLIRELAFKVGYKNERVVQELQKLAQLQMIGATQMLMNQSGGGGNLAQQTVDRKTPPNNERVKSQLRRQNIPVQ